MTEQANDILRDARPADARLLHELRLWMLTLGCTEPELRVAIRHACINFDDVRADLNKRE